MGRGHPLFLARTLLGQAVSSQGKSSASMLGNLNRTLNREGLVRRWRERRRFEKPTIRNQRIEVVIRALTTAHHGVV